jgi:hypothetical protein
MAMLLRLMQRTRKTRLAAAILAVAATVPSASPQDAPKYLTLDYQKPERGKTGEYVRLERDYWKPVHQDRVNRGKITSWKLYEVSFPNGHEQEYDFVTMTEFPSFAALEQPYEGTDFKKLLGESKYAEMRGMTGAVRKLQRSDTLAILLSTNDWSKAAAKRLNVVFLKSLPGKAGDLMKVQREYYMPSFEELIKAGVASSWATSLVRFPQSLETPYDYVSFNGYESLAQMEKVPPQDWIEKWRQKSRESMAMLNASRQRVSGQLWRLVEQTSPK